jgi:hypothetical protein
VISAGLGYVRGDTPIPSYDLTVRQRGPGSISARVTGEFSYQDWWNSVAVGPFASSLPAEGSPDRHSFILLCLSKDYARLVQRDLVEVAKAGIDRIRIFGLSIERALPDALRPAVLPYDERLGGLGNAGTRVDFPQRALLDYARNVASAMGDIAKERELIRVRLDGGQRPHSRPQRRTDDANIKKLIVNLLPTIGPSRSRLLAHIRHEEGLSCEQSRFSNLFREVLETNG